MTSPIPTEGGKHTPGPWSIHPRTPLTVVALNGNRSVATCGGYYDSRYTGKSDAENQANARLIAAAPALLDILRKALGVVEFGAEDDALAEEIRAALAKATGGDQ